MAIRLITSQTDLDQYDQWIKRIGNGNLWQSLERKAYLEALGKEVRIYTSQDDGHIRASALVMIDRTIGGYSTWEIPRGPVWEVKSNTLCVKSLLDRIIHDAKNDRCLALYLSPTTPLVTLHSSFITSPRHIHCEATRIIDLSASEEEILAQMKQKGRYNIKVAQKNDITVKESTDIDAFYDLVTKTGKRDGFVHLSKKQYQVFLDHLPGSVLLLAYLSRSVLDRRDDKQTEPIAGVLSVIWGKRLTYYYGASNHAHRALMAPYLLQWESIRFAKARGCTEYDLLGIAPQKSAKGEQPSPTAVAKAMAVKRLWPSRGRRAKSHPWEGVSHFKEKFGGEVVTYPKERIVILKPVVYWMLNMKRRFWR